MCNRHKIFETHKSCYLFTNHSDDSFVLRNSISTTDWKQWCYIFSVVNKISKSKSCIIDNLYEFYWKTVVMGGSWDIVLDSVWMSVPLGDLPLGVSKYPHMGIPTAVAPTTKQINPKTATHVEYKGLTSAISCTNHDPVRIVTNHHLTKTNSPTQRMTMET